MDKYKLYQINIKILSLWTLKEDLFIYLLLHMHTMSVGAWMQGCIHKGWGKPDYGAECPPLLLCAYPFEAEPFPELGAHTFSAMPQA